MASQLVMNSVRNNATKAIGNERSSVFISVDWFMVVNDRRFSAFAQLTRSLSICSNELTFRYSTNTST